MPTALSNQIPDGTVAVHTDGRKAYFRNGTWHVGQDPGVVDIDRKAPGAAFLPTTRSAPSKSEEAYYRKFREETNGAVSQARAGAESARTMENLLAKQETGGIYSVPLVGTVAGWFDPEIREMDALQAQRARQNRQPGEGAISDFDAQQFLNMTYGKDKPTETNRQLIRAQRLADDAAIQRRQFMEWHQGKFGTLTGAEEAWDRYAQDNPIFAQTDGGSVTGALNDKRLNWRQYFGDVRGAQDNRQTASYEDIRRANSANGLPRRDISKDLPRRSQTNSANGWTITRR